MTVSSQQTKISAYHQEILGDMVTPLKIFAALRSKFHETVLLEGGDNRGGEFGKSYILADPISELEVSGKKGRIRIGGCSEEIEIKNSLAAVIADYKNSFVLPDAYRNLLGIVGHTAYNCVQHFEDITFKEKSPHYTIPDLYYALYRYFIIYDHRSQKMDLYLCSEGSIPDQRESEEKVASLLHYINRFEVEVGNFLPAKQETSYSTDEEFLETVKQCKHHIQRGDVFQIVPSRCYSRKFDGDELQLYRTLRVINPSPFLFFIDRPHYKVFGSSPEAQIIIREGEASIFPIAGTYKRTGDDAFDEVKVKELLADEKENSEHVMLVDLARNDLSKHCTNVRIEAFREVHFYSHVIHLVSHVKGKIQNEDDNLQLFGDTFPAGTLSGAPKYRAMQLIDSFEKIPRNMYGGAIGLFTFSGDCIHAICIRSFVSADQQLFYQAGCGVVADSDPEKELEEINNKLRALRVAMEKAGESHE